MVVVVNCQNGAAKRYSFSVHQPNQGGIRNIPMKICGISRSQAVIK